MAQTTFTQLPAAVALNGTEIFAAVQAGASVRVTTGQIVQLTNTTASNIAVGITQITLGTAKGLIYNNGGLVGNLATATSGVLVTDGSGTPSISSTLPSGLAATNMNLTTPTIGAATGTSLNVSGTGGITAFAAGNVATPVSVLSDAVGVVNSTMTDPARITIGLQGNITVNATTGAMTKNMRGLHGRVSVGATNTQNITTQGLHGVTAEATTDTGASGTVSAPFTALAVAVSNPAAGITVSNMYGILGSTMGLPGGTTTSFAGLAFAQLANATNTTAILLGTTTIPASNYAIYDSTGYPTRLSGALTVVGGTTLSAALTYGGITLSNSVTGTGSMALSASPTFTGTVAAAAITASGIVTTSALKTSTALITAIDGGSTAAFTANMVGSTGGPATAAQDGWLKAQDSSGATIWIPVWK